MKTGQCSKPRSVFVNGTLCESMAAAARYASEVLGCDIHLWQVQRIVESRKVIDGLEIIRADEPLPRKTKKAKQPRKYTPESRRRMSEAGRKGKGKDYWRGKRKKDITRYLLSKAIYGEKHPRAKLTESQVLDIIIGLEDGEKQFTLALRYGVSEALISRIKHGRRWAHQKDDAPEWGVM